MVEEGPLARADQVTPLATPQAHQDQVTQEALRHTLLLIEQPEALTLIALTKTRQVTITLI